MLCFWRSSWHKQIKGWTARVNPLLRPSTFVVLLSHIPHNMNQQYLQAFRVESSPIVTSIPARYDRKTSQHVVRLKDIQHRFEDAKCIMNGEATVLFLTDDDLEE